MVADLVYRGLNPSGLSFHQVVSFIEHKERVHKGNNPLLGGSNG